MERRERLERVPGDFDVPYRVTPASVHNGSEVVHVSVERVHSKEDLQPIIQVEVSLQEGGPPQNPVSSAVRPIGGFLGYMHNAVHDVLTQFTHLLERGIH